MGARTEISWATATWNPFFGCTRVGPGCNHCYAILEAHRKTANPKLPAYFRSGVTQPTPAGVDWTGVIKRNSDTVWKMPERTKTPTIFFVNSMSDLFHENMADEDIVEVFAVMNRTPRHTYQVLTKRPNRMVRMTQAGLLRWTPNIWAGVTVESDSYVKRADLLRKVPAQTRFISAEPLLGPLPSLDLSDIHLLIVGGESGAGARRMEADWARDLRDRCLDLNLAGAPIVFHFKQWGAWGADGVKRTKVANGHLLDGCEWHDLPNLVIEARHGTRSVDEFRAKVSAERQLNDYQTIKIGKDAARIALRKTVLDTLAAAGGSMEAKALCVHDLMLVGLPPELTANVNIHAWALSDLVRKNKIRPVKNPTGKMNRRGDAVMTKHYEVVK